MERASVANNAGQNEFSFAFNLGQFYVVSTVQAVFDCEPLQIRVLYNGHFLCRAISQDLESQIVSLKEITEARKKRRTELKASLKRSCSIIDTLLKNTVIQEQEENIEITVVKAFTSTVVKTLPHCHHSKQQMTLKPTGATIAVK